MHSLLPFPPEKLAPLWLMGLMLVLAGCQPGSTSHPVPSVPQIGSDLKCSQGDHGYEDQQAGWGFCYPESWKYTERSQGSQSPPGLDLTFDITYVPATRTPCQSPIAGSSGPAASPCSGDFAFMIISTYERGGSSDMASWIQANLSKAPGYQSIRWGNAVDAVKLADGRRIALTPHHVVIMDLHSGLLNLESEMSARLNTWKFSF
jgi:hypothetical protein